MNARKILLDMDVGIDDAMAIAYLAARPDAEIIGLGAAHGNCSTEDSARNALQVLEVCGLGDVPVAKGAEGPLDQEIELADYVHGKGGLGECNFSDPWGQVTDETATEQMLRLASDSPGEIDLLAVAPLTNVGLAVREDPEVLTRFRSVMIMGGSGPFPPPPIHLCVDPNTYHDVAAAKLVYGATRSTMTAVGMNVTEGVILDEAAFARLQQAETDHGRLVAEILPFYLEFHAIGWGRRVGAMHDPITAAILVDPTYMTRSVEGPVNVVDSEEGFRARLMQLESGEPPVQAVEPAPPTTVATEVDGPRFIEEFIERMVAPLPAERTRA